MTALRKFLQDAGGVATVEAFMHWALHDPEHGYYTRQVREVGRSGDFSTSATLSPILAQAMAAWALARRRELGWSGAWHLIELGPGSGQLAAEILRALGGWTRRRLSYHLVESSTSLAEQQGAILEDKSGGFFGAKVHSHRKIEDALHAADGQALILSNEFVDAFPCAVFARSPDDPAWREVAIRWDEQRQRAVETQLEVPAARTAELSQTLAGLPASAMRVEVHFRYRDWLREWRPLWKRGAMLTIDYGGPVETLYHRRPRGTLRGYFRQQRVDGDEVFERAGRQDLTADVNFTALTRWGEAVALSNASLVAQREFVLRWNPRARRSEAPTTQWLDPAGAGGAFQVLEQIIR